MTEASDDPQFPQGKLKADDEGALLLELAIYKGRVILNFVKPVTWIGLPKKDALALAQAIIDKAEELP